MNSNENKKRQPHFPGTIDLDINGEKRFFIWPLSDFVKEYYKTLEDEVLKDTEEYERAEFERILSGNTSIADVVLKSLRKTYTTYDKLSYKIIKHCEDFYNRLNSSRKTTSEIKTQDKPPNDKPPIEMPQI